MTFVNTTALVHLFFLFETVTKSLVSDVKLVVPTGEWVGTLLGAMMVTDGPAAVKTKWVICPLLSQGARKRVSASGPSTGNTRAVAGPLVDPFNVNLGAIATGGFIIGIACSTIKQEEKEKKRKAE